MKNSNVLKTVMFKSIKTSKPKQLKSDMTLGDVMNVNLEVVLYLLHNQIISQLWWSGRKTILVFWVFLSTNWRWGLKLKLTENYQLPSWLPQIIVKISLKNISPSTENYFLIHLKSSFQIMKVLALWPAINPHSMQLKSSLWKLNTYLFTFTWSQSI